MTRSRPITGAASGDHARYADNYERIFGRPRCSACGGPLHRLDVGLCRDCLAAPAPREQP